MKRFSLIALLLCLCTISTQAQAQDRPFTDGPVWRITYVKVKPGKTMDYIKYLREHTKPISDEQKQQGLILDYKFFSKPTNDGPNDWDIAQAVLFRNYAEALDFNEARSKKLQDISLKHFGSAEARTKAFEQRDQLRDVLSSHLVLEEILKPMK